MIRTPRSWMTAFVVLTLAACAGGDDDDAPTGGDNDQGGAITALTFGQTRGGFSGAEDSRRIFTVVVPSGQSKFTVMTSGGTGDPDLYVRFGSAPTTTTYDCQSSTVGPNDVCEINNPSAGTWYILIEGFSAYSGLAIFPYGQVGTGGGGGGSGAAVYTGSFNPAVYRYTATSSSTGATCAFDISWIGATIELNFASTAAGGSATMRLRGRRLSSPTTPQATGPSGTTNCLAQDEQYDRQVNFTSALPNVDVTLTYSISSTNVASEVVRLVGTQSGSSISGTLSFQNTGTGRAGTGSGVITLNR